MDDDVDELHAGDHELYLELLGVGEEGDQCLKPVSLPHFLKNIFILCKSNLKKLSLRTRGYTEFPERGNLILLNLKRLGLLPKERGWGEGGLFGPLRGCLTNNEVRGLIFLGVIFYYRYSYYECFVKIIQAI